MIQDAGGNTASDGEHAARVAWITHVKRIHRNKRMLGFAGIVLGASMMVWWKLDPAAPDWSMWLSLGILAASWAVFVFVIVARWRWVKSNPYKPGRARGETALKRTDTDLKA